ncbi:hypothetical protein [Acidithiobacillus ferridurans]|uniref:Uncharacterized protein n=1 Tax=Acidithiobacillus ferridurans TaxID=1232575 RepID=A0A8X8KAH7_ACIFI|nr:hypothetical protein [Acidithiobacillus ferridurans]MBU2715845.1 hypothetical protein [Acidithiobacillus ferridurans]MBU2722842.1 hypothetical protein [Acidithiobacillus ferridurans]MBU2727771.1 hypothetical protein [Acidithiobacillus ferridurans]
MVGLFDDENDSPKLVQSKEIEPLFVAEMGLPPIALPADDLSSPPIAAASPLPILPMDSLPLSNTEPAQVIGLLPPDALDAPPAVQVVHPVSQAVSVLQPDSLQQPPPARTAVVAPQAAFGEPEEDPLIHQALRHALEQYPEHVAQHQKFLKAQFETVLPVSFDKITAFGETALSHVQTVLQEVSVSSQNFSALSVAAQVQEVTTEARDAANGSAAHGLGGLLKRVEHAVRPFDPQAAQDTLMRLYVGVKNIHGRLSGIADLAQETLISIQMNVVVMSVVSGMAEKTEFAQHAQRRHDLLLTTGQELQLALRQLDQLKSQTEQSLMQIEETRTVTLPSLGFLGAISTP